MRDLVTSLVEWLRPQAPEGFQEALDLQGGLFGHPFMVASVFPLSFVALALKRVSEDAGILAIARTEAQAIFDLGDDAGWRYFNLTADLPPDSDVLAQAIAVLQAFELPGWREKLAAPLRLLARNRVAPGRYRTWLVADPARAEATDAAWASAGAPVHCEVVANLLTALLRLDEAAYLGEATAGADWLVSEAREGRWASYWYYGHAYGSYQVLRLLGRLARISETLQQRYARAVEAGRGALLRDQRPDGGWRAASLPVGLVASGAKGELPSGSGWLETSLAMLALGQLPSDPEVQAARQRGQAFLTSRSLPPPAEPFYFTLGLVPYQSACLVSALALLALVSGHGPSGMMQPNPLAGGG